jgi:hypothetical protein
VRIATMIISLILMLVVGAQSCAVSLGDAALETKAAEQGGPIGLFMAFLFLIGGGFRARLPVRVRARLLLCRHHRARWGSEHLLRRLDHLGRRVLDPDRPQLLRLEGEAQEEARRSYQGSLPAYSPECVEWGFSEVRFKRILRTSQARSSRKLH